MESTEAEWVLYITGIVTIGMRGPGDVSLPAEDGIPLVNSFISAQRDIIAQVTGKDPANTPQVWTLYKEVQDWWDAGLRVPDDVTVMWCDDNWGNNRKLPEQSAPERGGGYGVYVVWSSRLSSKIPSCRTSGK